MEVLEQMRMLLREKAILFGQYEQETLRLDTDDLDAVDDIVDAVQARQALIDKINGLDRRLAAIGEASAYGARCFHIGKNQCDYAGLTEAEQAVFRVGQEVFAIMTRIRELEDGIPGKMAVIQEQLQEKIKKNNVNGKFTGYLKQMGQGSKGAVSYTHLNIVIPAMGDSMLFICEVRRRVERPEGGYGYGCEFVEMATKQEDLLYRYILRRQGDQLRRIR